MNLLKKRRFLSLTTILIVLCTLYVVVRNVAIKNGIAEWSGNLCFCVLSSIFSAAILVTYDRHDTNMMKPAIGMLLGVNVYRSVNAFVTGICAPEALEALLSKGLCGSAAVVLDVLDFVMMIGFCFNHLAISSGHHSSKINVKLNLFLCLSLCVEYLMQILLGIAIMPMESVIYNAVFYLLAIGDVAVILWVEMQLGSYD